MRRGLLLTLCLIPSAAFLVVLPLVMHGCSCGHDFDFHLISWMEAAAQFRAGVWHPAWAFSPAWNAGEPRFVFYPPISWTLGALLGLVLPWSTVPVVYTWLALVAAGFGMYGLARELEASPTAAAMAAMVYVANPYMIFTAYERTAYAELLAAAWIPLLLAAILRKRVTVLRVAVPVALLWLTNAPAAVMGCYALAVAAAMRLVLMKKAFAARAALGLAARVSGGVFLGLGLAAFYVVPAAYERRWVQIAMAMTEGMRIGDNFLFHHTADALHDEVLHTASVVAVLLLIAAFAVLGAAAIRLHNKRIDGAEGFALRKSAVVSLAVLTATIGLMLVPISAGVWRIAPEMAFLQFPWRLTAVLAAALCAAIAIAVGSLKIEAAVLTVGALVLVAAMSLPMAHRFRQQCDEEDTVAARLAVFAATTGTDPTDEYTPGDADNDALAHANPPYWLGNSGDAQAVQGPAEPDRGGANRVGQTPMHFTVDVNRSEALVLNLRNYPAWQVRVNNTEVEDRIERADGLIAFPVPAGHSRIDIDFGSTVDRQVGGAISFVAACGALGWAGWGGRRARSGIIAEG